MSPLITLAFTAGAAFFYVAASWMMKEWGSSPLYLLIPAALVTLAAACWFEIEVLKFSRLGHVMVLLLALELVMTFVIAALVLKESYSFREMFAVAVIACGIVVLSWSPQTDSADPDNAEAAASAERLG